MLAEREVAKILALTVSTLRNWRVRGGGPAYVKIGARAVRYRESDLEAFIDAGLREPLREHGGAA
ncbi:MAG: helix-turn-helix transcriptional regulator [Metallibacterium sp.]